MGQTSSKRSSNSNSGNPKLQQAPQQQKLQHHHPVKKIIAEETEIKKYNEKNGKNTKSIKNIKKNTKNSNTNSSSSSTLDSKKQKLFGKMLVESEPTSPLRNPKLNLSNADSKSSIKSESNKSVQRAALDSRSIDVDDFVENVRAQDELKLTTESKNINITVTDNSIDDNGKNDSNDHDDKSEISLEFVVDNSSIDSSSNYVSVLETDSDHNDNEGEEKDLIEQFNEELRAMADVEPSSPSTYPYEYLQSKPHYPVQN
eukprot:Pgem_evm1s18371